MSIGAENIYIFSPGQNVYNRNIIKIWFKKKKKKTVWFSENKSF